MDSVGVDRSLDSRRRIVSIKSMPVSGGMDSESAPKTERRTPTESAGTPIRGDAALILTVLS